MINNCVEINMTQYKNLESGIVWFSKRKNGGKRICHHKLTDNEVKVKERNCFNKYQGSKSKGKMEPFLFFFHYLSLSHSLPSKPTSLWLWIKKI